MQQLLGLIMALLAFAFVIYLISRAVKWVILVGMALIVFFALVVLGVVG
ncbi:MAG: hypothetical protein ACUVT7_07420 [Thermoplasmata archaeon]